MANNCLVGQSGGPTAVINASLVGVVKHALKETSIDHVLGCINGISGIINEDFIDFGSEDPKEINNLLYTPSAALGSVRFYLDHYYEDDTNLSKIYEVFKKYDIHYFFYIGGNDSMDSCNKIYEYFLHIGFDCKVLGIPKTIDNDLMYCDHTPGYPSACKYIATTISEIALDLSAYRTGRVTIVEIMGRDAGWLTASSKLSALVGAEPDLIYLPEVPFDLNLFLTKVKAIYEKKQKVLVVVSEGIKDRDGNYILKYRNFNNNDTFGHLQLGGVSAVLCEVVTNTYKYPVRAIELNLPQRCSAHLASLTDILEAKKCGEKAVSYALKNKNGVMVTINRKNNKTIYGLIPLKDVATLVKTVPLPFISDTGDQVTSLFIDYALPLIQGETKLSYENGLPHFAKLKKYPYKL